MADRMMMITWGGVARGQEMRAIEVFNEAMGILGRWQQAGDIESFDVALMQPNHQMDGYMVVKGTAAQIAALRDSDEFLRNTVESQLCVDGISHIEGFCNQGVAEMMARFTEASQAVAP